MAKIDDGDIGRNTSDNETFEEVVEARLSRRGFLGGTVGTMAAASLSGVGALLQAVPASASHKRPVLGFTAIPVSSADTVVVPEGYTAEVLIAWGDPVSKGPAFRQDASNSAADQARQWGMHNDGLVYFPIRGSSHGLLVQNNEYTDDVLLFPDGTANWDANKTRKSLAAHGVSIIEISKHHGRRHDRDDDDEDGTALRHHRHCRRLPLAHNRLEVRRQRRAERGQPLRVGRRDRSHRPEIEAGQAHGSGAHEARGWVGAGGPRWPPRRLHGRRRTVRVCGDPANPSHGSTIIGDKYGSPDGIYVGPSGRLWIQTDVSGSTINTGAYAGFGNNQMLCADPRTGETRRFLVGPSLCEVTGVFVTGDEKTMFVGIQHPGEPPSGPNDPANPKRYTSWPDGDEGGRPRSSVVVITKDDGGEIGT
jgi:secreted PhoX family phosphatase